MKQALSISALIIMTISIYAQEGSYCIVGTNVTEFYDNNTTISEPIKGEGFYGQDAHYPGNKPSYTDNGDGTVTDNITGLIWEKGYQRMTHTEALAYLAQMNEGERNDWRLPSIKELYSLMQFNGTDVSGADNESQPPSNAVPFINDNYFGFEYFANGDRSIDVQYYSTNKYTGLTMGSSESLFGLNVADGRIKGYPYTSRGSEKDYSVKLVRGNPEYGKNEFVDNNNKTVSDKATGLMWDKDDSQQGMEWQEALQWAQDMNNENHRGYNNWRVPNAKELHSIIDYSRSPQATNSAAIDSIFNISEITVEDGSKNYPFFWTSTTHLNLKVASNAVYICFGEAFGFFPLGSGTLTDVHGAGAQRSSPKKDNGKDYSEGHGPQGDVVRFDNYVRLVRDINENTSSVPENITNDDQITIYPNPVKNEMNISCDELYHVRVIDIFGRELYAGQMHDHFTKLNLSCLNKGNYIIQFSNSKESFTQKIVKE